MLNQLKTELNKTISTRDILNSFYRFKPKTEMKIGMELERLSLNKNLYNAKYDDKNCGVKQTLELIAENKKWNKLIDNGVLIGIKKGNTTITLEPGCQFEISSEPKNNVSELKSDIDKIDKEIKPIFDKNEITLMESGITPKSAAENIEVFPKKRYQYMARYLPGKFSSSMMRQTAGIQVTIDFKNDEDAIKKLRIFTKISPVMTAMFANSPIKEGKVTSYKSNRALAWLYTDNSRCGLISENLFDKNYNFTVADYMDAVLDVPMLYISRKENYFSGKGVINPFKQDFLINGKITFREFLTEGYNNLCAELQDYAIHQSLYFPEVRLKNYLEIRNHDCQKGDLKYSIPAIYKGLAYNECVLDNLIELFDEFDYLDVQRARFDVPKNALNSNFGKRKIIDLAKEILVLSKIGLKDDEDSKFLEPIDELISQGLCPADLVTYKNLV